MAEPGIHQTEAVRLLISDLSAYAAGDLEIGRLYHSVCSYAVTELESCSGATVLQRPLGGSGEPVVLARYPESAATADIRDGGGPTHTVRITASGGTETVIVLETSEPGTANDVRVDFLTGILALGTGLEGERRAAAALNALLNAELDSHYITEDLLAKERSENSRFQSELGDYSRKITDAIVETQEMERRRIARELHDGIGNTLSMTKLLLSSLAQESGEMDADKRKTLSRALELLDNAVAESRQLSRNLTSEMLLEHGLIPTLNEMIGRVNASGSLKADLKVFGITNALPRHIEQNLFRIIQELVYNVIKHAHATEATLQCIQHESVLIVMIEDDGIGMKDAGLQRRTQGMGLANIETRLTLLNGSMAIDSEPGRGTVITLEIPLPPA